MSDASAEDEKIAAEKIAAEKIAAAKKAREIIIGYCCDTVHTSHKSEALLEGICTLCVRSLKVHLCS